MTEGVKSIILLHKFLKAFPDPAQIYLNTWDEFNQPGRDAGENWLKALVAEFDSEIVHNGLLSRIDQMRLRGSKGQYFETTLLTYEELGHNYFQLELGDGTRLLMRRRASGSRLTLHHVHGRPRQIEDMVYAVIAWWQRATPRQRTKQQQPDPGVMSEAMALMRRSQT